MKNFQIGIISDWLRLPFAQAMEKCAQLGADGVQIYAASGEMFPENMTAAARKEKRAIVEANGLSFVNMLSYTAMMRIILPVFCLTGLSIGVGGSLLAIRKFLRV